MEWSQDLHPKSSGPSKFLILENISFAIPEHTQTNLLRRVPKQNKSSWSCKSSSASHSCKFFYCEHEASWDFYYLSYRCATGKNLTTLQDEFISKGNTVWQENGTEKWLKGKKEQGSTDQEKRTFETPMVKGGFDLHASSCPHNKWSLVLYLNSLNYNT